MTLTFSGVLRSEWAKVWSLRITGLMLVALLAVPVTLAIVRASAARLSGSDGHLVLVECVGLAGIPAGLAAAAVGVHVGILDLADDALGATYVAAPRRRWVVASKLLTLSTIVLGTALLGAGIAIGAAAPIVADGAGGVGEWGPLLTASAAGVVGQVLLSWIGLSMAVLLRSTTATVVCAALVLVVVPILLGITGRGWLQPVTQLLPVPAMQGAVHSAGTAAFPLQGTAPSTLTPSTALLVLGIWAAAATSAAIAVVPRLAPVASTSSRVVDRRRGRRRSRSAASSGATFDRMIRSEVSKLASVPSTRWLLGSTVVLLPIVAVLGALGTAPEQLFSAPPTAADIAEISDIHLAGVIAGGIGIAQLPLAILGALAMTAEVSTRSWQATLLAVPRPRGILAAKLVAVLLLVLPSTALSASVASAIALPAVAAAGFAPADAGGVIVLTVARIVVIAGLIAVLGVAAGALLRRTLPAVATLAAVLILAPTVLGPLQVLARGTPLVLIANSGPLLPNAVVAGAAPMPSGADVPLMLDGGVLQLDPAASTIVLAAWALGCAAMALLRRRARAPE